MAEGKSGWDSFWTGVIVGDFDREDDSWWKVVGQTLAGATPVVGQIGDVRDTLAAIDGIWEGREGAWTDLGMAGIGWIPALGDFAKGGIRIARKGAKAGAKIADEAADIARHAPAPHAPDFKGKLRGVDVTLPGVKTQSLPYTKRPREEYLRLRKEFENTHRGPFAKHLVADEAGVARMRAAGLTEADIALLKKGNIPGAYEVHHKIPLDDGGKNVTENFVLIQKDPYHYTISNHHREMIKGMQPGDTRTFDFPVPDGLVYPPKKLD